MFTRASVSGMGKHTHHRTTYDYDHMELFSCPSVQQASMTRGVVSEVTSGGAVAKIPSMDAEHLRY
jgi:hypothetical protein